ncbi:MAG: hypothetical protein ABSG59_20905 [Verrucomicrobiota bacterium]|jgi:hypothetical protein
MRVIFHPAFPQDVRLYADAYRRVSSGLAARFRQEIDDAVEAVNLSPSSAGHYLNLGSRIVPELRRRNLRAFPFFILYGATAEQLIFGSVIPSRSDPLTWLTRFQPPPL